MIWLTGFSVLLVLFSQLHCSEGGKGVSPWIDHAKANKFMTCLVQDIAISPVFQAQEKQDLEKIVETMMSAISSLSSTSGRTQIQAMDIAFASSLAEMVIANDIGNQQAVNMKASALSSSVQNCFSSVYGFVNKRFITEMQDLITMLTQEANIEDKEIDINQSALAEADGRALAAEDYGALRVGSSTAWTSKTSGSATGAATIYGPSDGSITDYGNTGAALTKSLSSDLASSLSSSAVFQSVFGTGLSSEALSQIIVSASQPALAQLGLSSAQVNTICFDIQNSLLSVGYGASITDYANAISTALVFGLQSVGVLNSSNINSIASSLSAAYVQSITTIASQYGIQVSQRAVTAGSATSATTSIIPTSDASQSPFGANSAAYGTSDSALSQKLSNSLSSSLSSSAVFQSVLRAGLSPQALSQITVAASQSALAQLGLSSAQANNICFAIQNSLLGVDYGASITDYANAISAALASGLQSAGVLNSSNVNAIASSLNAAYEQSFNSLASKCGIQVSKSAANGGSDRSTTTTSAASQSSIQSAASAFGTSSAAYGTSGSALSEKISNSLSTSLSSSAVFQSVFGAGLSSQALSQITVAASQSALAQLGLSSAQANNICFTIQNSLLGIGYGASITDYANAISTALASDLQAAGVLNSSNVNAIASSLSSAYEQSFNSLASQYSIQVSQSTANAGSDRSSTTTSAASRSSIQSAASPFGTSGASYGTSESTLSQSLSNALASSLSSSTVFQSVFGAGLSSQALSQITVAASQSALAQLGLSSAQANNICFAIQNSLLGIGYGASITDYANAISTALASGLQVAGVLNSSNVNAIASSLSSAYEQSFNSIASQYSIQVSQSAPNAGSDRSSTTTSAASRSSLKSAASAFGTSSASYGTSESALSQSLSNALASSLSSSTVFQSVFGAGLSSQALSQITVAASQSALAQLGLSSAQVNNICFAIQNSLLSVGYGASITDYANVISTALASGLQSFGVLNSSNFNSIASSLSAAYVQSFTALASQYGIQVSQSAPNAVSDRSSTTTSAASQSSIQSAASAFGTSSAAYGNSESALSQSLSNALASSLYSSAVLQSVFGAGLSSQALSQITVAASQSALAQLGLSSAQANNICFAIQNSLLGVGYGASITDYANAISTALASGLQSAGVLNSSNVNAIASSLNAAYEQSFNSLASKYGIQVSQSAANGGSDRSTTTISAASQSSIQSAASAFGTSSAAYGTSGSALSEKLSNSLSTSLSSSAVFKSVFRAGLSSQALSQITVAASQSALAQLGLSSPQLNNICFAIQNSLLSVGYGASITDYANAISTALASGLQAAGVLNSSNVNAIASSLSSAYEQSFNSLVSQYSIQVSQNAANAGSDRSSTTTSAASPSSIQSAASAFGTSGASYGTSESALSQSLSNALASSLSSSTVFQSVFGAGLSSQALSQITVAASQSALAQLGLSSPQLNNICFAIQNSLLSVGYGASITDYANAISTALASVLQAVGVLNSSNVNAIASSLSSAYEQSFNSLASQYSIQVSQSAPNAGSDRSSTTTSAASQSSIQSAASAFGTSSVAYGNSESALSQSLSNALASSLSSSAVFQSIFGAGLSSQALSQITVAASQSALAQLGLSSAQVNNICFAIQNSLLSVRYGASVTDYANAISTALASGLQSAGVLNSSNVNAIASSLSAAYVQSFTSLVSQYGIQLSQSAAKSDFETSATSSAIQSSTGAFGSGSGAAGASVSSLASVLSSSQILISPAATSRIQGLVQSMLQIFGPNGFQVNSFAEGLGSTYSTLVSSGLSPQQAQVEALMEVMVAMIEILSSAQVGSLNLASTSSISQSVASSLTAAFG